ncbi:MAG: cbb3-type cytochrome c oxidase subunit I [Saprospiraceae bacterium]
METKNIISESGIIITIILILIPILVTVFMVIIKTYATINYYNKKKELEKFYEYLRGLGPDELEKFEQRKKELEFSLSNIELAGNKEANDSRGLIDNISQVESLRFVELKKKSQPRPYIEPDLSKLILWYLGCATFWLLFGTTIGEYLGIKFVAPDVDHFSWLSFGRLRPVHTNAVFWGWASLAMMGLAYYVIPRVSKARIVSIKTGYRSLVLINASVIIGSVFLMAGINNGGGEYREYIWPVMALFGIGIIISLQNFFKTIAKRKTKEIYVSNWYIISAMMYLLVIAFVAYWPSWQNGLGETIVQGYYMHQGVGMWFMLFNLGLMYYFLPQQLNKPIYSYSLGILAFWAQILFYTLIGTHHFIFSAIPWWLQTVAIVGSAGMVIPVVAGTTNFLMTFKGAWNKLSVSYTLPFYLIGIIFYFTGSLQGTAEAFRFTNLVWHFTDFTVAHSHLTMYGIICFMLWGFIYTVVPRLTGKEPPQITVGAHFWLALIGLLFYTFPLMYGSTLRGLMWMEGTNSFIESVELMAPFWLWRAIGGSLMWLSHILFAYNFYVMIRKSEEIEIPKSPIEILAAKQELDKQTVTI